MELRCSACQYPVRCFGCSPLEIRVDVVDLKGRRYEFSGRLPNPANDDTISVSSNSLRINGVVEIHVRLLKEDD